MSDRKPLTVTVIFDPDDANLIEEARGTWTPELYVQAAAVYVARRLLDGEPEAGLRVVAGRRLREGEETS